MAKSMRQRDNKGRFIPQLRQKEYWPQWKPLSSFGVGYYDAFGGQKEPSKPELIKAFDDIVYACATLICNKVADATIKLYVKTPPGYERPKCATQPVHIKTLREIRQKRLGHNIDLKEVVAHPLLDLLNNANAYHNYLDLIRLTQLYLDITGNAFWLLVFNNYGIPENMVLLPSQNITAERDNKGMVVAWKFGQGDEQEVYDLDEIVHFKYPNLQDPYGEGLSPVRGAWQRIQVGWKELGYLDNTLSNMGRPDSVIAIKDSINILEAERLAKDFKQRFQGQGAGGPLVIDGTMNYQPLTWPPKDLAELELYKVVKTVICNCFGIPPDIFELGTSSNRSTREAAIYSLACDCVKPRLNTLVEKFNERLVPYFDDRLFFHSEQVVPEDKEFELRERDLLLKDGVITRNEARQLYGFEQEAWADEPLLPSGSMPADAFALPQGQSAPQQQGEEGDGEEATPEQAPAAAANDLRATVGGSQQILAMQQATVAGTITREMAIANVILVFGFTPEEAATLFPQSAAPGPAPEAAPTLNLAAKCGGEGGKPGPCPEGGADEHSARQQRIASTFHGVIDRTSGLSPEQKTDYKNATSKVISQMTPKALDRLSSNVKKLKFHADTGKLTQSVLAEDAQLKEAFKGKNMVIKGAYDRKSGQLDLDGSTTMEGKPVTTDHPYAHELSHALDKHEISKSPEWQDAFNSEIKTGAISKYAGTSPAEGFAEFGRMVYASGMKPEEIKSKFPKSYGVWKQHELIS